MSDSDAVPDPDALASVDADEATREYLRGVREAYTLELGVETEYGYVGGEEMVLVEDGRARYLTDPQTGSWTLGA